MVMPGNYSASIVHYWAGAYPGKVGWLIGPRAAAKTAVRPWLPYALDNDAFSAFTSGQPWDEAAWREMLTWARRQASKPRWAIVPDVVADAAATLRNWLRYSGEVAAHGFSLAFAVQDGMTAADVPGNAEVVFVGGSTAWKWRTVPIWAQAFPRVHVGRVNSLERLWRCQDLGVESVDGTGWFRKGVQLSAEVRRLEAFLAGQRDGQTDLFAENATA